MKKILKMILLIVLFIVIVAASYLFIGKVKPAENITWGVNFSQKHATNLGLDWKKTYLALLSDLGVKNLKVAAHWDLLAPEKDKFYFDDLDWQIREAKKSNAKIVLVIGMKTPRWPECHIPEWAKGLGKEEQQKEILKMLEVVVSRYKNSQAISAWQVENEPFFPFGDCPWVDKDFFKEEVNKVRLTDSLKRPVIISESGEGSFWFRAAQIGDQVGTTMYKKVWFTVPNFIKKYMGKIEVPGFYLNYPFPPTFYGRKAVIIEKIFGKKVIGVELQAEPWGPNLLYNTSLEEQEKTMNLKQFKYNVDFAKKTGLDTHYLWGGEWWFWLKEKQNDSIIWNEARRLFNQ